jgi:predicted transcriptional regulator
MKLSTVMEITAAEVLTGSGMVEREIIAAGAADLIEEFRTKLAKDALLITGVISEEVVDAAIKAQVGAILFVRGKKLDEDLLDRADQAGLSVLRTQYSMFGASGLLYMHGLKGLDGTW